MLSTWWDLNKFICLLVMLHTRIKSYFAIDNKDILLPKVRGPVWQAFVAASSKKLAFEKKTKKPSKPSLQPLKNTRSCSQLSTIEQNNETKNNNNPFLRQWFFNFW